MAKYRKKPVVIEAVQWDGKAFDGAFPGDIGDVTFAGRTLLIATLEGTMTASPGDYIIRGVQGELYPCKPAIFEATYDLVPDDLVPADPRVSTVGDGPDAIKVTDRR